MSDAAQIPENALLRGTSAIAKPEFFMIFTLAGLVGITGVLCVLIAGLPGFGILGLLVAMGATAYFTGLGEDLNTILVAILSLAFFVVSIITVSFMLLGVSAAPQGGEAGHAEATIGVMNYVILAAVNVPAIAYIAFSGWMAFSDGGGAGEQILSIAVAVASLLFMFLSVAVVTVAMVEEGQVVVAAIIDVFALAVTGWAFWRGSRG
jgi:hypothetical protein